MRSPAQELADLEAASLRRRLRAPVVARNFSGNDYLGLANSAELKAVFQEAVSQHGVGATAARLVCGTHAPHLALEAALAEFKGTEAALSFSSGYAAAVGALSAILSSDDIVILDKLSHASLVDGARLSGAKLRVFHHNDLEKLASHLSWANQVRTVDTRVLVVTESVFSMDGDTAPLAEIVRLKNEADALLLVDEAHALGVLGKDGRGLADALGVADGVDFHVGTLSKAVGVSGGYVCASQDWIDLLINKARSFIYSTAPPPAVAATAAYVLQEIFPKPAGAVLRERLWGHLRTLSTALPELFPAPQSAILPLILGSEQAALEASQSLMEQGFLIPAIRYPTVARGSARLRITLSATHEPADVDSLIAVLARTTQV
jgi:8-amino-7-oxononanoate synthase